MRWLVPFLLVAMLGCYNFQKSISRLNLGDSKEQVLLVMGDPHDTQMNRGVEVWQYFGVVSFGVCEYRQLWFRDGRLFGSTSIRKFCQGPGCGACMVNIDWSNPPDQIIEVRHR